MYSEKKKDEWSSIMNGLNVVIDGQRVQIKLPEWIAKNLSKKSEYNAQADDKTFTVNFNYDTENKYHITFVIKVSDDFCVSVLFRKYVDKYSCKLCVHNYKQKTIKITKPVFIDIGNLNKVFDAFKQNNKITDEEILALLSKESNDLKLE